MAATGCSRASSRWMRAGGSCALRVRTQVGIGAYTSTFAAVFATNNTKNCLSSVYVIPAIQIDVQMVFTNAAPLGPYRGAGRPEAIYLIERLIDSAAAAMGIDRVELRRRNFIPPSAMPYRAPNAQIYDSGRFEAVDGRGAGAGRLERLPGAAGRLGARGQAARHRARLLPRGRRRHSRRDGGPALRGRRHGGAADRRAGDGAGAPRRSSRRSSPAGSEWTPPRSGSSRATATRCRRARRASRRAR